MTTRRSLRSVLASAAVVGLGSLGLAAFSPPPASPQAAPQAPGTTFKSGLELVVVNVVVRDKDGKLVRGLGREDFVVLEDGKPQAVSSFDFEEIENASLPSMATTTVLGAIAQPGAPAAAPASGETRPAVDMKDRRLIVLFYDLGSMQPEEVSRAVQSGRDYVEKKMAPADILAVVSLTTALAVDQDFTADRTALLAALNRLSPVEGSAAPAGIDAEIAPDTGNAFVADDTEFNIFSTDRRLDALRAVADVLAGIEQKKSVVYFSGGVTQSGMDNQAAVRTLVDRARVPFFVVRIGGQRRCCSGSLPSASHSDTARTSRRSRAAAARDEPGKHRTRSVRSSAPSPNR